MYGKQLRTAFVGNLVLIGVLDASSVEIASRNTASCVTVRISLTVNVHSYVYGRIPNNMRRGQWIVWWRNHW